MRPLTVSQECAQKIMGGNFFGIEDVSKHFGVTYGPEQLLAFVEVPFSEATLEECKDTHILFAGFPMNTLEIRAKAPKDPRTFYSHEKGWYNEEPFALNECVCLRWYLMRKNAVPNSVGKDFPGQRAFLSQDEQVPRAVEFVYGIVLNFLAKKERLCLNIPTRCVDLDRDGMRVEVIFDPATGIRISNSWDDASAGDLVIASCRCPTQ
jgi:hypothetical protein